MQPIDVVHRYNPQMLYIEAVSAKLSIYEKDDVDSYIRDGFEIDGGKRKAVFILDCQRLSLRDSLAR